ncbi:MAG: VWA domain-containing protein [Chloroflexi bacterium]|nr:VWA domain-containing protein [Chloroflexota bacterium]
MPDLYASLGVARSATQDEIRQAFRQTARRFHPDTNPDPSASDEFKLVSNAYDILSDPQRRAEYNGLFDAGGMPLFVPQVIPSRNTMGHLKEPQVVYFLVDIRATLWANLPTPPLNVCLVIDRSNSMQGPRLEQVKSAAKQIIEGLNANDTFSVVAFSDRAEVIIPAQQMTNKAAILNKVSSINPSGGTEILQGLLAGLLEIQRNLNPKSVNHLILLTDGRTYGDEDNCLLLATLAESDGVTVSGLGIGDEWNDSFLDQLAGATGGESRYISSPSVVTRLLTEQVRGMGGTLAQRLRLQVTCDPGVTLRSAFKVSPQAQPVPLDLQPLRIGSLQREEPVSVLLEFLAQVGEGGLQNLARLTVLGDVLSLGRLDERYMLDLQMKLTDSAEVTPPPLAIVNALDKLTLYRLQEKAWAAVDEGDVLKATTRLEMLATRLISDGEGELAKVALAEAYRLGQTRQISAEARKRIKYGTRALIAPPKAKT